MKQTVLIGMIVIGLSIVMAGCISGEYPRTATFSISADHDHGNIVMKLNADKSVSATFKDQPMGDAKWKYISQTDEYDLYLIVPEELSYSMKVTLYGSGYATMTNEGSSNVGYTGSWK